MAIDDPGAAFKLVAGSLSLDFVNTVSGRLPNPAASSRDYADTIEKERLVGFGDLARWAQASGIVSAAEAAALQRRAAAAPQEGGRVVRRARALREAIYRVCKAAIEGWTPQDADLELLNRELVRARAHERLAPQGPGMAWSWHPGGAALDRPLWTVVRAAADLLTSNRGDQLKQCGGEDCGWLFLDTSRNRRRRWCDMADCGNRAKVRRFRRRRARQIGRRDPNP